MFPVSATSLDLRQFRLVDVYIRQGDRFWVAHWRGEFIGGLYLNPLDHSTPDAYSVVHVWVDSRFRRRGVATELFNAAEAELKRFRKTIVPGENMTSDLFLFWRKRAPELVKYDARNWARQYVGKTIFYDGYRMTVEGVSGTYPELTFTAQAYGEPQVRIPGELVYPQLGNPHPPAGQQQDEALPLAA